MHFKNVFIEAQLFLLSHYSFNVLETSSVSMQLGAFFCNYIKIQCLINISLLKSTPAGFYFPVIMTKDCICSAYEQQNIEVLLPVYFSHMARKKHYRNNNRGKRNVSRSGFNDSGLKKVDINNHQK